MTEPCSSAERRFSSFIKSNDPLGLLAASDCDALGNAIEDTMMSLTFPPLEALPCANPCPNPGNLPCASGDLRNVVRTVNALGSDYTGRLQILLNDTSKTVVSRNIVLLFILGMMSNEAVAADIALHFWYSVFLPEECRLRILAVLVLILEHYTDKTEPLSVSLGRRAKLTCLVPGEITDQLLYTAGPTLSTSQARDEYERVYTSPARLDARNRVHAGVKPCHSLAFMAFWRSGVVLPFSNNVEDPLVSWDLNEVIKSGQTYGAQPEDVYGCLYFFLSDQLRTFAKRIRELDVTFHVFNTTAQTLAQDISGGEYSRHNLTPRIRFDRVDLAHLLADAEHVQDVLTSWSPLLAQEETAVIVGVFPDWTSAQKDGSVVGADDAVVAPLVEKLIKQSRLPPGTTLADARTKEMETVALDAAYDNSKAFATSLKASAFKSALRKTALKRRLRHKVLPQRIRMPVDAKASDVPHLPDDETWYRYVRLAKVSFTTRYVELTRAAA
ncbi:hypothetical protein JVT61DRAFT_15319 [Boletus reticuloceps]|uniref:DUF4470 domain-containing protein n=1 Tax=Boletus reticuloceps TaxID=495285 RepID=A0A8I3ACH5_9AGAM|nr:hypothetical protein JVT61DRAFT_15319 [Boletus reticuloceps]